MFYKLYQFSSKIIQFNIERKYQNLLFTINFVQTPHSSLLTLHSPLPTPHSSLLTPHSPLHFLKSLITNSKNIYL